MVKKISKGSPVVLNVGSEEIILLSQVEEVDRTLWEKVGCVSIIKV